MDGSLLPPRPEPPVLEQKPRGSCLVYLGVLVGFAFAATFTVLMIGFLWPFVIGFAVLGIIALQYLVWGWWFERIYRSGPPDQE
jgi:hypothetical protein